VRVPGLERWRALPVTQRRQILTPVLLGVGLAFPFVTSNGGNVDAAANAFTYVLLALGLNIVVGFAGLLDLGYAAFFAIGAYGYGIVASGHLKPEWSSVWVPLQWAQQVSRLVVPGQPDTVQFHFTFWPMLAVSAIVRDLRHAVRRPTLRLRGDYPRHRDAGLRGNRAGRRPQLGRAHQRRPGAGRHPHPSSSASTSASPYPYYFLGPGWSAPRGGSPWPSAGVAAGPRLDGHSRGRVRGRAMGVNHALQAAGLRHGRRHRRAGRHLYVASSPPPRPTCSRSRCR
jgi:hypothetical protein